MSGCVVSGLPQYEATKAYMPKGPDELSLQQAELVIVLQKEEGEALHVHTAVLLSFALPESGAKVFCSSQSGAMGREWEMESGAGFLPAVPQRSPTPPPLKTTCSAWSACAKRPTSEPASSISKGLVWGDPSLGGWWGAVHEHKGQKNQDRKWPTRSSFRLWLPFVALYKAVTLEDNHVEQTV